MAALPTLGPKFPPQEFLIAVWIVVAVGIFLGVGKSTGAPIQIPDLAKCKKAHTNGVVIEPTCCPPYTENIVDFIFESPSRIRVRPAITKMTDEHIRKYKEATRRMKVLDKKDPRSFTQQANVHCAYCSGAYTQVKTLLFLLPFSAISIS